LVLFYALVTIHLVENLVIFIALSTELTKLCCNLTVLMFSKFVSTNSIQDSANTISVNIFGVEKNTQNVFHHPSRTLSSYFKNLLTNGAVILMNVFVLAGYLLLPFS